MATRAPASPVSASTCRRAFRLAARAISDMAKAPLRNTRKISRAKSMGGAGRGRAVDHDPPRLAESLKIPSMIYLLGDLQGCGNPLARLLDEVAFSPSRDHLYVLGDLVNRGPDSLGVLRRLKALGDAATCLLGNHDLHLLGVAHGVRRLHKGDTVSDILDAPDRDDWLQW